MESDLHPISAMNVLVKYADDTNLLVPGNTDVSLADEYTQIKAWADKYCVKINPKKTCPCGRVVSALGRYVQ